MLRFSNDPTVADRQMRAVIFYLTTFGYIDGDFDASERDFVKSYIEKLVKGRVASAMPNAEEAIAKELTDRFTTHFHEVFENIDGHVRELFTESVAGEEDPEAFVHAKLKLRCFELFQAFDSESQELLVEAMDELIAADGEVHPAEAKFRSELLALFDSDLDVELIEDAPPPRTTIHDAVELHQGSKDHPFFQPFEHHYSLEQGRIHKQIEADRKLLDDVMSTWDTLRETGDGKLSGARSVEEFTGTPFLDGHVHVHPLEQGKAYELTVLGDLHGCYSCLKGAVLQSDFFAKVADYKNDPSGKAKPILVLLGDYIDRGLFSLNGVLRTVLQIYTRAPEHVFILRGNHEYYLEYKGQVYGGVKPAEAINTLKPHLPIDVFRHYIKLFDAMPTSLLFGRALFVHGGIPRDSLIKERYQDLSFLNDPDARFQMMWSDPSSAEVIPAALQDQSARFPFGRLQALAFLHKLGCHTIVRGHEKENDGFNRVYDDRDLTLLTIFSAGGKDNGDLPEGSSYRSVTPKALTMRFQGDSLDISPWNIDYATYNDPEYNGFFRSAPELEHRK
ncbi:MAG: metallophosphoesterase [Myxococcota bacterium]